MTPIRPASTAEDLAAFGTLVREYVDWLAIDLGYQDLETELADLASVYGPPGGVVLLAERDGSTLGGVAVRPRPDAGARACEMKRLYVRPAGRGLRLGEGLVTACMAWARGAGYRAMVLDTIAPRMGAAVGLYRSLGFRERAAYYDSPVAETLFLEARL